MTFLNGRADDFLIGATLGPVLLGVYAVAYRVLTVMIDVLSTTSRSVAFPVFSRVQKDRARLGRAYTSVTRMCAVIAMPGYLLAFAAAPEIVTVVFGHKWHAAIPVMRILALFGPVQAVSQFNGALLQSIGRARLVFRLLVASTVLQVIAFAIAVPFGIEWVAASLVIRAYLLLPIGLYIAAHAVGGNLRSHVAALVAPAVSGVGMAAAVIGIGQLLSGSSEFLRLVVELAVALPIYAALLRLTGPVAFREAVSAVTSLFERRRSLAGAA
jgi:O-antigen/teichoic acid export membrane protein